MFPKHYSLHSETDKHFVIHDQRDNKTFHVAKKDIHPANQMKIMKMQKLSEGGGVDPVDPKDVSDWMSGLRKTGAAIKDDIFGGPNAHDLFRDPKYDQAPQSEPAPASVPDENAPDQNVNVNPPQTATQAPQAPQDYNAQLNGTPFGKAFSQEAAGIQQGAQAQAQGQAEMAKQQEAYQQQMRDFNYQSQQEQFNKKTELDNMMQEMQGEKIDPDRFWHDKSTGSKIGTALALVLGGIGSGLTRGPNQAMQMIDKLMDRDLESQKANMNNKHNLYNLNLRRYNDQNMADQSTRLQMATALQSQIQATMARTNSALAKAQGQQMLGQLEMQKAQILQGWGVQAAKNKVMGAATGEGGVPVTQEHPMLLNDKDYVNKRVVVGDKAFQASSDKDAEELRSSSAMLEPIERDLNMLKQLGPEALVDPAKRRMAQGITGRLAMTINEFNGYKRFTDVDAKTIEKSFNDPSTLQSLLQGDEASNDTLKALRGKMESEYRHRLVNYTGGKAQSFQPAASGKLPLNSKGK